MPHPFHMSNRRHLGLTAVVVAVVTVLGAGAVVVAQERSTSSQSERALTQPAAQRKPQLALTASARTVDAGTKVTLRLRTATRHPRDVRVQRWDARRRAWGQVSRRTVRATSVVRITPPTGSTRYRAVTPKRRDRVGGSPHTHRAATSATIVITARVRMVAHEPATLTADERALLTAVTEARSAYARSTVTAATDEGADRCLTTYARSHSAWMAQIGSARDPGSREHRAAGRELPGATCRGRTVWSLTRAVGAHDASTASAIAEAVDAWLSSPYGETSRLLTACHEAPAFEYGLAVDLTRGGRWLTVLIAADTSATKSSGAC